MSVATTPYVPDRGDVVWLEFDLQAGHEQAGRRLALVLSAAAYNTKSSLMLCCPVTSQVKGYPFEVPATPAAGSRVAGVVLADQVRNLGWRQRNASKMAAVTPQCILAVGAKIKLLIP